MSPTWLASLLRACASKRGRCTSSSASASDVRGDRRQLLVCARAGAAPGPQLRLAVSLAGGERVGLDPHRALAGCPRLQRRVPRQNNVCKCGSVVKCRLVIDGRVDIVDENG